LSPRALPATSEGQQIRSEAGADGQAVSGSPGRFTVRMKEDGTTHRASGARAICLGAFPHICYFVENVHV